MNTPNSSNIANSSNASSTPAPSRRVRGIALPLCCACLLALAAGYQMQRADLAEARDELFLMRTRDDAEYLASLEERLARYEGGSPLDWREYAQRRAARLAREREAMRGDGAAGERGPAFLSPAVGATAALFFGGYSPSEQGVPAALSSPAFDAMKAAMGTADAASLRGMLTQRRMVTLGAGTRATVLSVDRDRLCVRVLDGPHAGRTVFVFSESWRDAPPERNGRAGR